MSQTIRNTLIGLGGLLVLLGIFILRQNNPAQTRWMPCCPLNALTGLYCPGCGTGRGLHALLHGDLVGCFTMNPLLVPALALAVVLVWKPKLLNTRIAWIIVAGLVFYAVARNIPVFPFTLLSPR